MSPTPATDSMPVIRDLRDFDVRSGNRLERLVFNHRAILLAVCAVVTLALGALAATRLGLQPSFEKMIPRSHPWIVSYLEHRKDLRGMGNAVRIAVENPDATWVKTQLCGTGSGCTGGLLATNVQGFKDTRLVGSNPVITFCTYLVAGVPQYRVNVAVSYNHPEFFPLAQIAALAAGKPSGGAWNWTVDGSAEMRMEHDLTPPPGASC